MPPLPETLWHRLPSAADTQALAEAARKAYGVPDDADFAAASGTQALIQLLPWLAAPGPVAIVAPTYGEHATAWRTAGHAVATIDHLDALPDGAVHAVVVNPNNPDGRVTNHAVLARAATLLKQRGGWLVIDEAFADVDPAVSAAGLCSQLPVLVLRSFGKFYGLAGLRLGFAISAPPVVARIAAGLGPWPCSGPALVIGAAALEDHAWIGRTREKLVQQARRLDDVLMKSGFEIAGGVSLFRLARHARAQAIHQELAQARIWCRRFDWADDLLRFGLPPDEAGLDRLSAALRQ